MRIIKRLVTIAAVFAITSAYASETRYEIEFTRIIGESGTATATAVIDDALFLNGGVPGRLQFSSDDGLPEMVSFELVVRDTGVIDGTYTLDSLAVSLTFDAPLDPTKELLGQETAVGPGPDFVLGLTNWGLLQPVDVSTFGAELRDPATGALLEQVWFRTVSMTPVMTNDFDSDSVVNDFDNCFAVSNPDQADGDGDGYGNACDGDFNQDCAVNGLDLNIFSNNFLGTNPVTDLNSDGVTNFEDLILLSGLYFSMPGPSGATSMCN